ncbi:MAG: hypothetical protein Aurels2KO_28190 [Aureliella sp.]
MTPSELVNYDADWRRAAKDFSECLVAPLKDLEEKRPENGIATFAVISEADDELRFSFVFHEFRVRIESDEDGMPIFVCRQKRDWSDLTEQIDIVLQADPQVFCEEIPEKHSGRPYIQPSSFAARNWA